MSVIELKNLALDGKKVLIRQDLNVPIKNGEVTSDKRIQASVPTIKMARAQGAAVILMSHLGRPEEGKYDTEFSLYPVAKRLSALLGLDVRLQKNWLDGVSVAPGEIVLVENVRFNCGEKSNDATLAKKIAALCDVFVMDAFGSAHRAHASTYGVAEYAPIACAGPLLVAELEALGKALENPQRPLLAIVGGAKVSTKLTVLESLAGVVNRLVVGGGIANTFIKAAGGRVGQSLYEESLVPVAQKLLNQTDIPIPSDVVCGKEFSAQASAEIKSINEVADDDMIFDIGPESTNALIEIVKGAGTIVWNGPVGVFEFPPFAAGTRALAFAIADTPAFSIAGGGDTLAAIDAYKIADKISYISTGGGAFLEFLEGKKLPAVAILEQRFKG